MSSLYPKPTCSSLCSCGCRLTGLIGFPCNAQTVDFYRLIECLQSLALYSSSSSWSISCFPRLTYTCQLEAVWGRPVVRCRHTWGFSPPFDEGGYRHWSIMAIVVADQRGYALSNYLKHLLMEPLASSKGDVLKNI